MSYQQTSAVDNLSDGDDIQFHTSSDTEQVPPAEVYAGDAVSLSQTQAACEPLIEKRSTRRSKRSKNCCSPMVNNFFK
jgi:hypothetical protein